jgi:hypothetical protein
MARDHQREQRTSEGGHRPKRRITLRDVRREEPDLRKLVRAFLAIAAAEAAAQAEHDARSSGSSPTDRDSAVPKEAA